MKSEKGLGLLVNTAVYLLAFIIGCIPYYFMVKANIHPVWNMLVYTCVATFVVYVCCLIFKNTSIYDPYWSVAPFVMVMIHMVTYKLYNPTAIIFAVLVFLYAFRLTRNWVLTYKGLDPKYEDWRYQKYRNSLPRWQFEVVNFVGLIYLPTIIVFASLVPGLFLMQVAIFNPLVIIGFVIMLIGPILELISDYQVHKFIKNNDDHSKVCNIGLWNYSRHPNYLGELTFWLGISVSLLVVNIQLWYVCLGYLLMVLLFIFISIPLMEKHNIERRPDYKEYKKHTSMLLILPRRK